MKSKGKILLALIVIAVLVVGIVMVVSKQPDTPHEHKAYEYRVVEDATCENDGSRIGICECGEELGIEIISAKGHECGEWKEVKAATCTEKGSEERKCVRCDYKETREKAALGHDLVHHEGKEPTETEVGWKAYDTCKRCDYSTYEEIPAIGSNEMNALKFELNADGKSYAVVGIEDYSFIENDKLEIPP